MKKMKAILMAVLMLVSMMAVTVSAEDSTYNGFVYSEGDENVVIYDYVGTESEITVPATISGKPVTALYTSSANDTVTKVTLEEGILELGNSAFMDYSALETINLPASLEAMGQSAISHAPNVENVYVAEGNEYFTDFDGVLYEKLQRYQVKEDGEILFDEPMIVLGYGVRVYPAGKTGTSYTVLDKVGEYDVVEVGERAFSDAKYLESIVVPESINRIWYAAFEKCVSLKKLVCYNMKYKEVLPEGVGDEPEAIFGYDYNEETGETRVAPAWAENLTVYCYEGSDMDSYVTSYLASEGFDMEVVYLDNTAIGENDNVIVMGKEDNAIESGTVLVVSDVPTDELDDSVKEKLGDLKYTVMDISLMKDGVVVQPNGEVLVSIALPEGFDGAKCKVYHIAEDGTFTDMKATYADGKLTFTTDHFSNYVVVEGTIGSEEQPASPKTGDMLDANHWGAWMLVACGMLVFICNKKKYAR